MYKLILKLMWKCKGPKIAKTILRKENKTGGILPNSKTYYKATIIEVMWYWHKDRILDQRNKTESPELNCHVCCQLIFSKGARMINCSKNSLHRTVEATDFL